MAVAARKIRRRRIAGELTVEQTRDLAQVASMLVAAGMLADGLESPGGCYLIARLGDDVAGAVGIETRVDAALMRSLLVSEAQRRRGIGAALISAARTAAHTRGARRLYALASGETAARYLARFGFAPAAPEEMLEVLAGTFMADYLRAHPGDLARNQILSLDISDDGLIPR